MYTKITFLPRPKALAEGREEGGTSKYPQIHWRVSLHASEGAPAVWSGIYSQGIGHHPLYKQGDRSVDRHEAIMRSLESGKYNPQLYTYARFVPLPAPSERDVLQSLALDASALDHPTFESWAGDYGYDTDSRKAEATYRACISIGLALRSLLGDEGLHTLQNEAAEA